MITASVAHLIPGMMSLSLVGKSAQMIPQQYMGKGKKPKKTNTIKGFTEIMIGVPLIGATAGMVSGL